MNFQPPSAVPRREFLYGLGASLGSVAFSSMLAQAAQEDVAKNVSSANGPHFPNVGGMWQDVVFGFSGLQSALNAEALIIVYEGERDEEEVGVARFVIDSDRNGCEFAVVVADEWQERGLGKKLMQALISHANSRGIKRIHGSVLRNNSDMLQFVKGLGFEVAADPDDSSVLLVNKYLSEQSR